MTHVVLTSHIAHGKAETEILLESGDYTHGELLNLTERRGGKASLQNRDNQLNVSIFSVQIQILLNNCFLYDI